MASRATCVSSGRPLTGSGSVGGVQGRGPKLQWTDMRSANGIYWTMLTAPSLISGGSGMSRKEQLIGELRRMRQDERLEIALAVLAWTPPSHGEIDVTPFREQFLIRHARDHLTYDEAASRAGWTYGNNGNAKGDGTRFQRRLGLKADASRGGRWGVCRFVTYETAVDLCRGIDIDPVDVRSPAGEPLV